MLLACLVIAIPEKLVHRRHAHSDLTRQKKRGNDNQVENDERHGNDMSFGSNSPDGLRELDGAMDLKL